MAKREVPNALTTKHREINNNNNIRKHVEFWSWYDQFHHDVVIEHTFPASMFTFLVVLVTSTESSVASLFRFILLIALKHYDSFNHFRQSRYPPCCHVGQNISPRDLSWCHTSMSSRHWAFVCPAVNFAGYSYVSWHKVWPSKSKMASNGPSKKSRKPPEICVKEEFKIAVKIAFDRFRFEEKQKGKIVGVCVTAKCS